MSPRDSRRPSYYGDEHMDLMKLQAMGAIVPKTLFKREIDITYRPLTPTDTWQDPEVPERQEAPVTESVTVYIRKRNSADMLDVSAEEGADQMLMAVLRCVCKEDGMPLFESLEQVRSLETWVSIPLINIVSEVNRYDAKKSQPRTSSGAPSPSPSAGASRNSKSRSRKKSGRSG